MFTVGALVAGALAAYIIGLSKTGLPGSAVIAVPLFATVFGGRLIAGALQRRVDSFADAASSTTVDDGSAGRSGFGWSMASIGRAK